MAKKLKYILLGALTIIILSAALMFFAITTSTTVTAMLNVENGTVKVNQGKGWITAKDEMKLKLGDKVKTEQDGQASIILYESTIISLEPKTEVSIEDLNKKHLKVKQTTGKTWNKFTGLLGVEGLSIETPNTVATVRGTSFEVGMNEIIVGEGEVEVTSNGEKITLKEDEKAEIEEYKEKGKRRIRLIKKRLTKQDREKIIKQMKRNIKVLRKIRKREINKKRFLVQRLKKKYKISDEDIEKGLREADEGKLNLDEIERKIPIRIEGIKRIKGLTEKIIKQQKAIQRMMQRRETERQTLQEKPKRAVINKPKQTTTR
ncbi:hypothetical protein DRJ22_01955 [Candidatus Woesearchaeota archaeon]|nr:MAG: hypothetical protein DRJ22_01955 [Candidatus Woesearchaeota archaeon]